MGCTHSKNSKSKVAKSKEEQPLERSIYQNRVTHFDETKNSTESTSNESVGPPPPPMQYSKNLLNETNEPKVVEEKKVEEKKEVVHVTPKIHPVPVSTKPAKEVAAVVEKNESTPHTAIPPTTSQHKQFVPSMYYPMPTVGEKQKSPEKKKQRKKPAPVVEEIVIEEKKKKVNFVLNAD
uniref:Uncharacterized protein n=1 Tax=Caenorhabditis japonica TaxID=281687 RepID=A0A8R1E1Q7_CAEJA